MERDSVTPRTYMVGAHEFRFHAPPTAADVLDWTVWIQCIQCATPEETGSAQATAALDWACKWLIPEHTSSELDALLMAESDTPTGAFRHLVALCEAIAESAGMPDSILDDMVTLLDRKNGVPDDWRGECACSCARCRAAHRGSPNDSLPDNGCIYLGLAPVAVRVLSRVSQAENPNNRMYVEQVRAIIAAAESRRMEYERTQREAKDRHKRGLAGAGFIVDGAH